MAALGQWSLSGSMVTPHGWTSQNLLCFDCICYPQTCFLHALSLVHLLPQLRILTSTILSLLSYFPFYLELLWSTAYMSFIDQISPILSLQLHQSSWSSPPPSAIYAPTTSCNIFQHRFSLSRCIFRILPLWTCVFQHLSMACCIFHELLIATDFKNVIQLKEMKLNWIESTQFVL